MKMKFGFTIFRFSLRHLWRQKWQTFLLIVGILLGVGVVIAIDYSNESSKRALTLSTQSVTGKSTHQIVSSGLGIPDNYFSEMKRNGVLNVASPIIEGYVKVSDFDQQALLILGIDPLLDFPFRSYYGQDETQLSQLFTIISEPDTAIISKELASTFEINLGDLISYQYEGKTDVLKIVGFISSNEPVVRETVKGLIIVDIATAQEALNKVGYVDRVELILNSEKEVQLIRSNLEPEMVLRSTSEQNFQLENMVAAFQLNLTALSLLALVVGGFLIYNTMTFSIVQRRELIGLYRSFGFFKSDIFAMIIFEALIIGVIGTFLGVVVGSLLGRGTVNLILQTINDLYFVINVKEVGLSLVSVIKGVALGIFATVLVSIPPAIEATQVTPRVANLRSGLEDKLKKYIGFVFLLGLFFIGLGIFFLFSPNFDNLWWAFLATLLIVIAFAIFSALILFIFLPKFSKFVKRKFGLIPGMATRELYRSLSRTAVAVSSLMIAVAVTVGMAIMINSFRNTVTVWLKETLSGDIYISVPNQFANRSGGFISEDIVTAINQYPHIKKIDTLLTINGISDGGDIQINVISNQDIAFERIFTSISIPNQIVWQEMQKNKILVAEPLANRLNLQVGSELPIQTPKGQVAFEVLGVFSDYTSSQGYIMVPRPIFEKYWDINGITAMSIILPESKEVEEAVQEINKLASDFDQQLLIRSNQSLRNDVLVVFDRTFAITNSLRFITTIVSFIGILSATLIILIDRRREFGILKSIGMRKSELNQLLFVETGLMGVFAGIFAIPTGIVISLILVYVINLRSFGWTIQFSVDFWSLVQGLVIAIVAAMLATIYPIRALNRLEPIQVIREE